jgi:hypothetical protein
MNRLERRTVRAMNRSSKPDPVVAIHEAGHAVGRVLMAEIMRFERDEAIAFIDMNSGTPYASSTMVPQPQATTYGPMYSRPMNDFLSANSSVGNGSASRASLILDVAMCKAAGIDVLAWARAKTVIAVAGPISEAFYTQREISAVIESPECANDLNDAIRDCTLAGMSGDDKVATMDWAVERATTLLSAPNVWQAVTILADSLPSSGRMQGKRAAQIIVQALGSEWR